MCLQLLNSPLRAIRTNRAGSFVIGDELMRLKSGCLYCLRWRFGFELRPGPCRSSTKVMSLASWQIWTLGPSLALGYVNSRTAIIKSWHASLLARPTNRCASRPMANRNLGVRCPFHGLLEGTTKPGPNFHRKRLAWGSRWRTRRRGCPSWRGSRRAASDAVIRLCWTPIAPAMPTS
jgi:hypothetical protein